MDNDRLPCPSLRQPVPGSKIVLKSTRSVKRNAKTRGGWGKTSSARLILAVLVLIRPYYTI